MAEETKTEKVDEVVQVTAPVSEVKEDVFDKDRAMKTIENLREVEKEKKKLDKKLAELEANEAKRKEAEMSELEKAQKRTAELEVKVKESDMRELRRSAAEKTGLPLVFANRLQGETPEELEADAKVILEALPKTNKTATINATNPGGATKTVETDAEKRARILGTNVDPWAGALPVEVKE